MTFGYALGIGRYIRYTIAALRTQIDEAAFSYMWAAGRVMALEQAIAYALQETDVPDEGAGAFHDVRVPG